MLKIGITGGIGSGKSTVCRLFALYGIAVYDSDSRAAWLMNHRPELMASIKGLLGEEAYVDGRLDSKYVAKRVFGDPQLLQRLNGLVHPAVGDDFGQWAAGQNGPYVILESAILFESGFDKMMDATVTVSAPEKLRMERTAQRDSCRKEQVAQRVANQMDDPSRESMAGYVIVNDGFHPLIRQVERLHKIFSNG